MKVRAGVATSGALALLLLAACSSDEPEDPAQSRPCDLLRQSDATDLLGGPVERIGFAAYIASSSTVPAEDQAQVEAAAERICMYRTEEGDATAALQLDLGLFENEAEFRSAFEPEVEVLDSPGLASNYETTAGDGGVSHFGVLLNEAGDSFDLRVSGRPTSKADLRRAAAVIVDRYEGADAVGSSGVGA